MPVAYAELESRARGRKEEGDRERRTREGRRGEGRGNEGTERGHGGETGDRSFLQSCLMNEVAGSVSIACPRLLG